MDENQTPNQSVPPVEPDATAAMPPVHASAQPPTPPAPSKRPTPGWVWALVGGLVVLLIAGGLYGAYALGQRSSPGQTASETTATAGAEVTESVPTETATSGDAASGDSGGEVAADSASVGSDDEVSTAGDTSGDSAASADAGAETAESEAPITDGGGEETVEPTYRSVLKVKGTAPYTSGPISLQPGHMEMTIWITRTSGHPLRTLYRRGSSGFSTWWSTSSATAGQSRTIVVPVTSAAPYAFRVECPSGTAWTMRVRWKP